MSDPIWNSLLAAASFIQIGFPATFQHSIMGCPTLDIFIELISSLEELQ
jgi:hypothetical protein